MSISPSSPIAAADTIPVPKTTMEKAMTSTFAKTGLTTKVGSYMMLRPKLIAVGVAVTIVSIVGMIAWSYVAGKVEHAKKAGGCNDTDALDSAHTWSMWTAIFWGIISALALILTGCLVASYFI